MMVISHWSGSHCEWKLSEEETPCDWTGLGKAWGEWSRKKWGLGHPSSNGRRAFPHLEMGYGRLIHTNGPDGLMGQTAWAPLRFNVLLYPRVGCNQPLPATR